jgi:nucleotide-binding universal stress UspA family protein
MASAEGPGPVLSEPEVSSGDPERVLPRLATARRAALIVVGLGQHEVIDRIFGSETALKVSRVSRVPVLAVPAQARAVPRRVVVGLDFSGASLKAARVALRLLPPGGELHLVHVIPRGRLLIDPTTSDREYEEMVRHRSARFRSQLDVPPAVTIEQATCIGNTARALVDYANRHDADMIAAGSHGQGIVSRLALGSVTTALLRAATTSMLVVPSGSLGEELEVIGGGGGTLHLDPSQWPTMLADFSRTNAGRRTRLEVDDPEMGAQAQEVDYPLLGITFDPHDQRLEIMLGGLGAGAPHLSRSIDNVRSLDVLTASDGTDIALRVQHGAGQTMLTFPT